MSSLLVIPGKATASVRRQSWIRSRVVPHHYLDIFGITSGIGSITEKLLHGKHP